MFMLLLRPLLLLVLMLPKGNLRQKLPLLHRGAAAAEAAAINDCVHLAPRHKFSRCRNMRPSQPASMLTADAPSRACTYPVHKQEAARAADQSQQLLAGTGILRNPEES